MLVHSAAVVVVSSVSAEPHEGRVQVGHGGVKVL